MPKLEHLEKLGPHLAIGVQRGKGLIHDAETKGVWTARIQIDGKTKIKSTKVKYDGGSDTARKMALEKAYSMMEYEMRKRAAGIPIGSVNYAKSLLYRKSKSDENEMGYLQYIEEMATENASRIEKNLEPTRQIVGGRGFYEIKQTRKIINSWNKYLSPFLEQLRRPIQDPLTVESITERELDGFDDYLLSVNPSLAIDTRLQLSQELRRFFKWCKWKGHLENIPPIKRPHRGGVIGARKRMRREITDADYLRIVKYTRDQYKDDRSWALVDSQGDTPTFQYYRDFQYLFHLWILILANTGIRPPTGGTKHTLMRWEDVKIDATNKYRPTLIRKSEKGHEYTAIIMPNAVDYFDALKRFYGSHGMDTDSGYVFAHFYDNRVRDNPSGLKRGWKKGDPILSFRQQWVKMGRALDLIPPEGVKVPQSQRISPSSLRSYFITQRIYNDVDIAEVARITGTSFEQIETRYFRMNVEQRFERLSQGGYTAGDKKAKYINIDGVEYYDGHE